MGDWTLVRPGSFQSRTSAHPAFSRTATGAGWPTGLSEFVVTLNTAARAAGSLGELAMASNERFDIPFDQLALEPMDDKVTAASMPGGNL